MKKLLLSALFLFGAGMASAEMATELSLEEAAQTVSPCRYWRSVSGGGYVCSSYAFSMRVPDAHDVDREIRRLEQRIKRLEEQLNRLQNK